MYEYEEEKRKGERKDGKKAAMDAMALSRPFLCTTYIVVSGPTREGRSPGDSMLARVSKIPGKKCNIETERVHLTFPMDDSMISYLVLGRINAHTSSEMGHEEFHFHVTSIYVFLQEKEDH